MERDPEVALLRTRQRLLFDPDTASLAEMRQAIIDTEGEEEWHGICHDCAVLDPWSADVDALHAWCEDAGLDGWHGLDDHDLREYVVDAIDADDTIAEYRQAVTERRRELMQQSVLEVEPLRTWNLLLTCGGPDERIQITWSVEGRAWEGGEQSYRWGDEAATHALSPDQAAAIAELFGIDPETTDAS